MTTPCTSCGRPRDRMGKLCNACLIIRDHSQKPVNEPRPELWREAGITHLQAVSALLNTAIRRLTPNGSTSALVEKAKRHADRACSLMSNRK